MYLSLKFVVRVFYLGGASGEGGREERERNYDVAGFHKIIILVFPFSLAPSSN